MRSVPPSLVVLAICDFLLLAGCFALAASWTQISGALLYLSYEGGWAQIGVAVAATQLTLYFERVYEEIATLARMFQRICLALGVAFLVQAILAYSRSRAVMPRWTMILGGVLVLVLFPAWRRAAPALLTKAIPVRRLLFLTPSPAVAGIAAQMKQQPEMGLAVEGYLGEEGSLEEKIGGGSLTRLGGIQEFEAIFRKHAPHRIVVSRDLTEIPIPRLLELQRSGTRVEEFSSLYESITGRISALELEPNRLIFSSALDARRGHVAARDIYSIAIGALLLAAASPMLALAAWAIKRRSPGPVFVREPRVGLQGAEIRLFRFRSVPSPRWVGRIGNLPLLINVARGDLALAGPAPERPEFASALRRRIPFYGQRLSVKPGLTGWAQVHASNGTPDSLAALEYDLYYVKHLSAAMDAYILLLSLRGQSAAIN
jgi:lipopolysaccharide/colanic/teichoic acid biosynthesis glycosyltransferase